MHTHRSLSLHGPFFFLFILMRDFHCTSVRRTRAPELCCLHQYTCLYVCVSEEGAVMHSWSICHQRSCERLLIEGFPPHFITIHACSSLISHQISTLMLLVQTLKLSFTFYMHRTGRVCWDLQKQFTWRQRVIWCIWRCIIYFVVFLWVRVCSLN